MYDIKQLTPDVASLNEESIAVQYKRETNSARSPEAALLQPRFR